MTRSEDVNQMKNADLNEKVDNHATMIIKKLFIIVMENNT